VVVGPIRRRVEMAAGVDVLVVGQAAPATRTRTGIPVRIAATTAESLGAALILATGSEAHVRHLQAIAAARGMTLDERGLRDADGPFESGDEASVYEALGFPWIPPELREDRGELDGTLPPLVTLGHLRGDLHAHSSMTDGKSTIEELAAAAAVLGHEYLAITDHFRLTKTVLAEQHRRIDEWNAAGQNPRLLKGAEVDILETGTIIRPKELAQLEWVVGSLHTHLELSREAQTARAIRAIESGLIDCLGHPTGRLLEKRAPVELDLEAVARAAAAAGVALEIDAAPERLDLGEAEIRIARAAGAMLVISSDAHATPGLNALAAGVDLARRAHVGPRDVVNSRTAEGVLEFAAAHRKKV
jgi:DNA polymerase (family 10)